MTGDDLAQIINEGEQDPELQMTLSQLIALHTQCLKCPNMFI